MADEKDKKTEEVDPIQEEPTKVKTTEVNTAEVEAKAKTTGLGTGGLVLGIIAAVFAFIPILNVVSYVPAILAIIFGGIALSKETKKTRGIIIVVLGIAAIIIAYIINVTAFNAAGKAFTNVLAGPVPVPSPKKEEVEQKQEEGKISYTLGETFKFDDLEITLGKNYSFNKVDNQFSDDHQKDVLKVPVTVKNLKNETHGLNTFYYSFYGSKGTKANNAGFYFDDSIDSAGDSISGATQESSFYMIFDGDGKYTVEFSNFFDKITVEFDVKK